MDLDALLMSLVEDGKDAVDQRPDDEQDDDSAEYEPVSDSGSASEDESEEDVEQDEQEDEQEQEQPPVEDTVQKTEDSLVTNDFNDYDDGTPPPLPTVPPPDVDDFDEEIGGAPPAPAPLAPDATSPKSPKSPKTPKSPKSPTNIKPVVPLLKKRHPTKSDSHKVTLANLEGGEPAPLLASDKIAMPPTMTPREKREALRQSRRSMVVLPSVTVSSDQKNAAVLRLRGPNPNLQKYAVRITFLDGDSAEYQVTEDWTVGDLTAAVANSIGLYKVSALFHLCEGLRNSSFPISSSNFERWLPRRLTLPEAGIIPGRSKNLRLPPIVFRMRWFKMPLHQFTGTAQMAHQIYLHIRRSLIQECMPLEKSIAVYLAALQCQIKWGAYTEQKCKRGRIAVEEASELFSSEVLKEAGDLYKLESMVYDEYKKMKNITPTEAEERFVRTGLTSSCPLTGGTVYAYQAANGVQQKIIVLRDGLGLYIDGVFRFVPFCDIAAIEISKDGTEMDVTILDKDRDEKKKPEILHFTAHEPSNLYNLLSGFICLARPLLPPAAPDTTQTILPPEDLPRADLFEPYPLRDNILVAPSVAHYFWKRYHAISADEGIPICTQFTPMILPVLRPFDREGFNEYEYLLEVAREQQVESSISASLAMTNAMDSILNTPRNDPSKAKETSPFASMTTLDLSQLVFKKQQLEIFARALAEASDYMEQSGIAQNFSINTVILTGLDYPIDGIIKSLEIMCSSKLPLQRVIASKIGLTKRTVQPFTAAVMKCQTLVELNVSDNNLGNDGITTMITTLAEYMPDFDCFVCNNTGINDSMILTFQNVILQKKRPTRLRVANNSFSHAAAKKWGEFLSMNSDLKEFDISGCSLGKNMSYIIEAIPSARNLRRLYLAGNKMGKEVVLNLAESIANGTSQLDFIDLSDTSIKKAPMLALLGALSSLKSECHNISITNADIPKDSARAFEAMTKVYMKSIRLRNCGLSSAALKGISTLIAGSEQLTFVDLACNTMSRDSIRLLGMAVGKSRSITELDVSFCELGTDSTAALFESIANNTSLQTIRLAGSRMSSDSPRLISNFVNSKTSVIESIDLRRCAFPEPLVAAMIKAFNPKKEGRFLRKLDLRGVPGLRRAALEPLFDRLGNVLILM